ncbi:MAG: anthranilate synthase component I [Chloroflexi bacterium]|nr:MAG: anthranilate synthase component I [Phototrophicales bacterium]RMF77546.1 MAG: anthranilate synthase component I [Chloroflexota bacterium]
MVYSPRLLDTRVEATPGRDEVLRLFERGDLVPVYRTLLADLETPVSVYLKLMNAGNVSFLLESVEGGEQVGRYSFLGVNPKGVITVRGGEITRTLHGETTTHRLAQGQDPLHAIKQEFARVRPVQLTGLPRFVGGAVGFLSYDVVRYFECLPDTATDDLELPDAAFMLPDTLVIFDHAKHQLIVLANAHNTGDPDAAYDDALERIDNLIDALKQPLVLAEDVVVPLDDALRSNMTRERHREIVEAAKEYIAAGDAFQIVLSQRFSRRTTAAPFTIYRALRALNPSPYMFFLRFSNDFSLIGASPEMMVRLEDGIATVRPIAGTRKRGATDEEDKRFAEELLADPKERAEHVMLVDLGRNDLGRVCDYGTVNVTDMMYIERFSHVMHIVSQVEGRLREGMDAFELLRATFPAGTLSGAPKVRAMEIIEELEGTRRGTYGGAVGYFSFDGSMDMCITIRALVMRGDTVYIQSGGGIVADSDPALEYEETINKAKAVAVAIRHAEEGLI